MGKKNILVFTNNVKQKGIDRNKYMKGLSSTG